LFQLFDQGFNGYFFVHVKLLFRTNVVIPISPQC
jgi:hypothetical protein